MSNNSIDSLSQEETDTNHKVYFDQLSLTDNTNLDNYD